MDWSTPQNAQEVHSFLGVASYYRHFVNDFVTVIWALHHLSKKGRAFHWLAKCEATSVQLCEVLEPRSNKTNYSGHICE